MQPYIRITCKVADFLPLESIKEFQGNFKKRTKKEIDQIIVSILKFGFSFPFFVWQNNDNWCLDGHGRLLALREMKKVFYALNENGQLVVKNDPAPEILELPIVFIDAANKEEAKQKMLRLNSQYGSIDIEGFREFIDGLEVEWEDLALPSGDLFNFPDISGDTTGNHKTLAERFIIPPLSVFRCTNGIWQERKKAWLSLGIQSEKGRDDKTLSHMAALAKKVSGSILPLESIFDPVLCEIMYRWFCPTGGQIFDPFAGGSVRGIIAGILDYNYTGIDLRQEQVDANYDQIEIVKGKKPIWICGDSRQMDALLPQDFTTDFILSCPPYADLEVYSKQPEDLSNMNYSEFSIAYREIIKKSCSHLRDDAFACFVVGEVRSKKGSYYGFVPDTVKAFEDAGMRYYNEMILVTQIAAKSLIVAQGFVKSRKIGKIHQNILVFVKGDPKKAALKCKIDQQELIDAISEEKSAETEEVSA
jgi:DNA modification methylase